MGKPETHAEAIARMDRERRAEEAARAKRIKDQQERDRGIFDRLSEQRRGK